MDLDGITERVIGAAIRVHSRLGPGLLESAYRACLGYELGTAGIPFRREVAIPLVYDGVKLDCGYRADFIVQREVILEIKAVKSLELIDEAQLLSYLKLTRCPVGLLINFNNVLLRNGIRRMSLRSRD